MNVQFTYYIAGVLPVNVSADLNPAHGVEAVAVSHNGKQLRADAVRLWDAERGERTLYEAVAWEAICHAREFWTEDA